MDRFRIVRQFFVACMLTMFATGCLKDGVMPTPAKNEGPVDLAVELVVGGEPFRIDQPLVDWDGDPIRFTALKFYLSGLRLFDEHGSLLMDHGGNVLLVDGARNSATWHLGVIPNGHVEHLELFGGLCREEQMTGQFAAGHVLSDTAMQSDAGRLHLLMTGYLDHDRNGLFDPGVDQAFAYRAGGVGSAQLRHMHLHADMTNGEPLTLGLRIDVRFILLGIDLAAHPFASGDDPYALAAMTNLVTGIYPWY